MQFVCSRVWWSSYFLVIWRVLFLLFIVFHLTIKSYSMFKVCQMFIGDGSVLLLPFYVCLGEQIFFGSTGRCILRLIVWMGWNSLLDHSIVYGLLYWRYEWICPRFIFFCDVIWRLLKMFAKKPTIILNMKTKIRWCISAISHLCNTAKILSAEYVSMYVPANQNI